MAGEMGEVSESEWRKARFSHRWICFWSRWETWLNACDEERALSSANRRARSSRRFIRCSILLALAWRMRERNLASYPFSILPIARRRVSFLNVLSALRFLRHDPHLEFFGMSQNAHDRFHADGLLGQLLVERIDTRNGLPIELNNDVAFSQSSVSRRTVR